MEEDSLINMTPETITIIIPVYNVQDYIRECLDSVAKQTYGGALECIIVDDCGSDNSIAITETFIQEYCGNIHFRIVTHQQNKGLSAARNTGIREAKGEYLLFIDSDDKISPDCISSFIETLEKYPCSQLIQAGAKVSNGERTEFHTMEKVFPDYADNKAWILHTFLKRGGWQGVPVTAWNRLVKRSFLVENNLFFKEGILHEDELWNFQLALKLSNVAFCKRDTYYYRIREKSITNSIYTTEANARTLLGVWAGIKEGFSEEWKKTQVKMFWGYLHEYYSSCKDKKLRKILKGYLWWLVFKGIWPTSLLIFLYLTPVGYDIRFLRKIIVKGSRIENTFSPNLKK